METVDFPNKLKLSLYKRAGGDLEYFAWYPERTGPNDYYPRHSIRFRRRRHTLSKNRLKQRSSSLYVLCAYQSAKGVILNL